MDAPKKPERPSLLEFVREHFPAAADALKPDWAAEEVCRHLERLLGDGKPVPKLVVPLERPRRY